jgi:GNAT superfamily N-acetyltransferase
MVSAYKLQEGEAIMACIVRPACLADLPIIVEFNQRMAAETENKHLDAKVLETGVTAVLTDPNKGVYYLAEAAGHVVGQLMLTYEWSDWRNGWLWWIQSVYVRATARRQGIFRALYNYIYEAACRDPQVIGLRLYMEQDNHTAEQTYLKLGMEPMRYRLFQRSPL